MHFAGEGVVGSISVLVVVGGGVCVCCRRRSEMIR